MSSYSDLATQIINKKGQGGRFSGLNQFLDVKQAYADAQRKFQFDQTLAKQQGLNAGYAGIINSSNMYGTDPSQALTQFKQAVDNNGVITPPNDAGGIASGGFQNAAPVQSISPSGNNGYTPSDSSSGRNEAFLTQVAQYNPGRAATIKSFADYRGDPVKLGGRFGQALMSQVNQYDPNFDAANYKERQNFIQSTWDKGELSKQRLAIENVVQHTAQYQDYQAALQNGDTPRANAIMNGYRQETGNSNITNAAQFARVVAVESAKVLNSSGIMSDQAYSENVKNLPVNASSQQSQDSIQNIMTIVKPRINSVLERYKERMGKYPSNGFTPEMIDALKKVSPNTYNELAPKLGVQGFVDAGNQVSGSQSNNSQGINNNDPLGIR